MRRARNLPQAAALAALLATVSAPLAQTPGMVPDSGASAPVPAEPGQPVSLIADEVAVDAEAGTVTASGNVEILYGDRVLRASRIVYSDAEGTVVAEGPLRLIDPELGVIEADDAALTTDLAEGLVQSARLLLAGELQIAAAELRRTEGRYTVLHETIASTCEICTERDRPTWAIRAERIIRDEVEELFYLRNATLEIFGLPVLWLPYFRIPDPNKERASGLLTPVFRRSDIYGIGLKLPYYFVLGPSADLTLTPFLTTRGGVLLEGEYRRRFVRGGIDIFGVVLPDDRLDDRNARGAASIEGYYDLGQGFLAELDLEVVSDDAFLEQFDYPNSDRLTSTLQIQRTRAFDYFRLGAVAFQSLRPEEASEQLPLVLPEFTYRRLWWDALFGGRVGLEADGVGLLRDDGQDVLRLGGGGDWRRDWVFGPGLVGAATTGTDLDLFHVREDAGAGDRTEARAVPFVKADLRWPLVRASGWGVHVVEPIGELAWSEDVGGGDIPNEDSLFPEFDETNLFALDRFPGRDRIETGLRANLGLRYALFGAGGSSLQATFGRVVRFSDEDQFAAGTGLAGGSSDWVGAVEVTLGTRLTAINRIRFDDSFDISRNEFSFLYNTVRAGLRASWVFLQGNAFGSDLGSQPQTSEIALDARYRFLPNWQVAADWRYDAASDSTLRAGAGITYGNECAEIDLSVSRRYTSSGDVPPSTSIGFVVRLAGLGVSESDWPRRACSG
jgi:LPS-assembly protein